MLKLGRKNDGSKYAEADLADISVDEIKKMIEVEIPGAFTKKAKAGAAAGDKKPAKKAARKKAAPKKK